MNAIRWIDGQGEATVGADRWRLGLQPRFGFAFDALAYADGAGTVTLDGVVRPLTPNEIADLDAYLGASPTAGAGLVHGVGPDGAYLGLISRREAAGVALSAPPAPTGWRWASGAWARVYARGEAEVLAWERIKAERDRRKGAGVTYAGAGWHTDDASRIQYLGLKTQGIPAGLKWKTIGGTFADLSPAVLDAVMNAVAAYDTALFVAAETHRARMRAAADPLGYDFAGGWPAAFAG